MTLEIYNEKVFENIKHINEHGQEYWTARELQEILEYTQWRNFLKVIEKAKEACLNSKNSVSDHFADVSKMVETGVSTREIEDILLTRYACYLIVQNGDSRKKVIALGQSYFAIQTRKQEISENFAQLDEDKKRLGIRTELKEHNKKLVEAAKNSGVETSREYATFQNHGYKGLYGGLGAKDIKEKKGLKKNEEILDHMGSTELAANLFRATQTEEKLRREQIQGKAAANKTHYEVGKKVRKTIEELGGTMPEELETPEKSIKQIEKESKKKQKISFNNRRLFDE